MRKLAALSWSLGLSYGSLAAVFAAFGVSISRMTAWRDVQALSEGLRRQRRWPAVRVLELDGAYVRGWGDTRPVLVAVDLGTGQPVALGHMDEWDPRALRRFLAPLVKRMGVSVIVTDDLRSYRRVAQKLEVEQQVCQFHVRRWVGRSLYRLRKSVPQAWLWVLDEVQLRLAELPPEGSRRLFELWKQIPVHRIGQTGAYAPLEQLRHLLLRKSERWASYRVFDWHQEVPWTNNTTEQVIGRMQACPERSRRIRSRTVRGYKTKAVMLNGLLVAASAAC